MDERRFLDAVDAFSGLRLQLPTLALAAWFAVEIRFRAEGTPDRETPEAL